MLWRLVNEIVYRLIQVYYGAGRDGTEWGWFLLTRSYYFNQLKGIIFRLSTPPSGVSARLFPQQGSVSHELVFWKPSREWTELGAGVGNQKKIPHSRSFSRAEWGTQLVAHVFRADNQHQIWYTFHFQVCVLFLEKKYITPLMLALLLATIIIFKTDIRPEAGCHL